MLWIPFTLFAAFMQAWRNAFQKQLSQELGATSVTLARFVLAGPLAALYLSGLYYWRPEEPLPHFAHSATLYLFAAYIIGAAVSQIVATALMVRLFQLRNYAVGVGLAKSEAIWAAILGVAFFGTLLSPLGWVGVLIGGLAVGLLSGMRRVQGVISPKTLIVGVASGLTFALTSLWVREASLLLELSFPFSAAWVLLLVISLQTL